MYVCINECFRLYADKTLQSHKGIQQMFNWVTKHLYVQCLDSNPCTVTSRICGHYETFLCLSFRWTIGIVLPNTLLWGLNTFILKENTNQEIIAVILFLRDFNQVDKYQYILSGNHWIIKLFPPRSLHWVG